MNITSVILVAGLAVATATGGAQTQSHKNNGMAMTTMEKAVLGGGCFWCLEAVFERIDGVKDVVSGYAGGTVRNPSYKEVCTGQTGHAEVVEITFDPSVVSYEELLKTFWECHNPTTLNRQGADVGTQYRSVIFYMNDKQKAEAEKSMAEEQKTLSEPIVTEIKPLGTFYKAEEYHQDYYARNPEAGYCQYVIKPKLKKLEMKAVK